MRKSKGVGLPLRWMREKEPLMRNLNPTTVPYISEKSEFTILHGGETPGKNLHKRDMAQVEAPWLPNGQTQNHCVRKLEPAHRRFP